MLRSSHTDASLVSKLTTHLAPAISTRHPCFHIVLSIGRSAQLFRRHVQDAICSSRHMSRVEPAI